MDDVGDHVICSVIIRYQIQEEEEFDYLSLKIKVFPNLPLAVGGAFAEDGEDGVLADGEVGGEEGGVDDFNGGESGEVLELDGGD